MAATNKSLARTDKSVARVRATKGYQPEGDLSHLRRVKRLSLIPSANYGPILTRNPA
jgi:hypothetical protein